MTCPYRRARDHTNNSRLQPCRISAKSSGTAPASCTDTGNVGNLLDFTYNFSFGTANNGNVMGITNNGDTTRSQTFAYDTLNRLATAQTASTYSTSALHCWGESYGYDTWANLQTISVSSKFYTGCTQENLSVIAGGNNRITTSGYGYDASGNMTADGLNTYAFNAESQIKTGASVNYTYDGDGNRVQKSNGKIYWYGAGTEILDETDLSGNVTSEYVYFGGRRVARRDSGGNIYYYMEDFLGSSRVITTATGTVCYDADFYPYGGERAYTNTCPQNYKFEGKERDTETNIDDFGARYYSSSLGRWLSADWSAVPTPVPYANLTNPQTLNLYAMVHDNPETFADLDGHEDKVKDPKASDPNAADPQKPPDPPPQNRVTPQSLAAEVPPEMKAAIGNALKASNAPTADDKKGGYHEESVKSGSDASGNVVVSPSVPGPYAPPGTTPHTNFAPANPKTDEKLVTVDVFAHIHPIGGADRTFVQGPSRQDIDFAKGSSAINLVVGAADKKVYFYNGSGQIGKPMNLKDFMGGSQ